MPKKIRPSGLLCAKIRVVRLRLVPVECSPVMHPHEAQRNDLSDESGELMRGEDSREQAADASLELRRLDADRGPGGPAASNPPTWTSPAP